MRKSLKALFVVLAVATGFAFSGCSFNANSQEIAGSVFRKTYGDDLSYYQFAFRNDGTYEFESSEKGVNEVYLKVYEGKYTTDSKLHLTDEKCTKSVVVYLNTGKVEVHTPGSAFHKEDFSVKYKFDGEKLILKSVGWEEEYSLLRY